MKIRFDLNNFNRVVGYLAENGFYLAISPVYDGIVCEVFTSVDNASENNAAFDFTIHGESEGHKEGLLEITGQPFAEENVSRAVSADELIHMIEEHNMEAERPISEEELHANRIINAYLANKPVAEIAEMYETTAADVLEVAMWYEQNKDSDAVKAMLAQDSQYC